MTFVFLEGSVIKVRSFQNQIHDYGDHDMMGYACFSRGQNPNYRLFIEIDGSVKAMNSLP